MHRKRARAVAEAVLAGPGVTPPDRRRACAERAARLSRDERPPEPHGQLEQYLDKVATHAYRVVDDDIDRVRESGLSEDEIFELTVSAALGAAHERLERGLTVVGGGSA